MPFEASYCNLHLRTFLSTRRVFRSHTFYTCFSHFISDEEEQRETASHGNNLGVNDPYCSRSPNRCSISSPSNRESRVSTTEASGSRYCISFAHFDHCKQSAENVNKLICQLVYVMYVITVVLILLKYKSSSTCIRCVSTACTFLIT